MVRYALLETMSQRRNPPDTVASQHSGSWRLCSGHFSLRSKRRPSPESARPRARFDQPQELNALIAESYPPPRGSRQAGGTRAMPDELWRTCDARLRVSGRALAQIDRSIGRCRLAPSLSSSVSIDTDSPASLTRLVTRQIAIITVGTTHHPSNRKAR